MSFCLSLSALAISANELTTEKCFLWEIQSKNSTVYLLGSLHMLRPEMYPLNACMEQAYEQAHVIAVEVNILTVKPQEMHRLIQENGFYPHTGIYADSGTRPAGQSLQTELSPKTLALLK
ncbi:MAG: TraB/GumN family protein, partial [Gammaproteobacteria bacterium]|nr:TraB/GumN family protein [Gammaproteobacteria bacterium]